MKRPGCLISLMVCGFILFGLLAPLEVEPPRVFYGWISFLRRSLSQMTVRWEMIASGLITLGAATAVLHLAARWGISRISGSGTWTVKSTLAVTTITMALFVASFVATGIGHQVAWLRQEEWTAVIGSPTVARHRHYAHQLVMGLKAYSDEHAGRYPASLEALAPSIFETEGLEKLKYMKTHPNGELERWVYLGDGMNDTMPAHLPILASPRAFGQRNHYLVLRLDGRAESLDATQYNDLMNEWRETMRAASP